MFISSHFNNAELGRGMTRNAALASRKLLNEMKNIAQRMRLQKKRIEQLKQNDLNVASDIPQNAIAENR